MERELDEPRDNRDRRSRPSRGDALRTAEQIPPFPLPWSGSFWNLTPPE